MIRGLAIFSSIACAFFVILTLLTSGKTHQQAIGMVIAMLGMLAIFGLVELARRRWPY